MCTNSNISISDRCNFIESPNYFKLQINGAIWYKVVSINNIIDILRENQGLPYMLISGNTGNGVYRIQKLPKVYIDINGVSELRKHIVNSNIILGANVNLTEAMQYLTEYSKVKDFKYVAELVQHIDLIANVPVRNVCNILYYILKT